MSKLKNDNKGSGSVGKRRYKINDNPSRQANIGESKSEQEKYRKAAEIPPRKPKKK